MDWSWLDLLSGFPFSVFMLPCWRLHSKCTRCCWLSSAKALSAFSQLKQLSLRHYLPFKISDMNLLHISRTSPNSQFSIPLWTLACLPNISSAFVPPLPANVLSHDGKRAASHPNMSCDCSYVNLFSYLYRFPCSLLQDYVVTEQHSENC